MSPRMPSRCGLIAQQSMPRSEFQTPFFSSLLGHDHDARVDLDLVFPLGVEPELGRIGELARLFRNPGLQDLLFVLRRAVERQVPERNVDDAVWRDPLNPVLVFVQGARLVRTHVQHDSRRRGTLVVYNDHGDYVAGRELRGFSLGLGAARHGCGGCGEKESGGEGGEGACVRSHCFTPVLGVEGEAVGAAGAASASLPNSGSPRRAAKSGSRWISTRPYPRVTAFWSHARASAFFPRTMAAAAAVSRTSWSSGASATPRRISNQARSGAPVRARHRPRRTTFRASAGVSP